MSTCISTTNKKSVMDKIKDMAGKKNRHYDMKPLQGLEIYENSECHLDAIFNGFTFGYMQGMKAAKAEMKKQGGAIV